jgi:hypothetical protein
MKRFWIEYRASYEPGPMSFWVHVQPEAQHWTPEGGPAEANRTDYDPPLPAPVPGKGFPLYHVEVDGCVFVFASLAELDELLRVFSLKAMPTPLQLSRRRGENLGPNKHWLSRLPASATSYRYRQKAVKFMEKAKAQFIAETGGDR